jgi:hypothetical protein
MRGDSTWDSAGEDLFVRERHYGIEISSGVCRARWKGISWHWLHRMQVVDLGLLANIHSLGFWDYRFLCPIDAVSAARQNPNSCNATCKVVSLLPWRSDSIIEAITSLTRSHLKALILS